MNFDLFPADTPLPKIKGRSPDQQEPAPQQLSDQQYRPPSAGALGLRRWALLIGNAGLAVKGRP
jgi:hypothetical protein